LISNGEFSQIFLLSSIISSTSSHFWEFEGQVQRFQKKKGT